MEKILFRKGEPFVVIYDEQFEELLGMYTWFIDHAGYVRGQKKDASGYRHKKIHMHRLLMNLEPKNGIFCDHINRIKTDNRLCNLRLCDTQKNQWNRGPKKGSWSKYIGVSFDKRGDRIYIRAGIKINKKSIRLGNFETQELAAKAYDEAAKLHYGEYAYLNFP